MSILLEAHSGIRWLIVLVAIIAPIVMAQGWLSKREFSGLDRALSSGLGILMGIQFLIGLVLLLWLGFAGNGFTLAHIVHMVILTTAVFVASLPSRWKRAEAPIRFRNAFLCEIAALVLIYVGVATVGGWRA